MERRIHKVCALFPPMIELDYKRLVEDIEKNGQLDEIWIHPEDGSIIDGRHRYKACLELGREPRFREWSGEGSLTEFVLSLNLHRRHLSATQLAQVGLQARALLKEEAEARMRSGVATAEDKGKSSEKAGALVGVSGSLIDRAEVVRQKGAPELQEAVANGEVPVTPAAAIATNYTPEEQAEIVKAGKKAVAAAAKAVKQTRKSAKQAGGSIAVELPPAQPDPALAPQAAPAPAPAVEPEDEPLSHEDAVTKIMELLHGFTAAQVRDLILEMNDLADIMESI